MPATSQAAREAGTHIVQRLPEEVALWELEHHAHQGCTLCACSPSSLPCSTRWAGAGSERLRAAGVRGSSAGVHSDPGCLARVCC